ncbi:MAG TPA: hypothetical protein VLG38_00645 [Gammaproteobacteria bacterium]|nr:hypothetical protein [Gammaproteobacteria bacterium]
MQTKFISYIAVFLLCLSSAATYAASNASLWGSIDQPVPPIQQIEKQQEDVQAQQIAIENEKTICELIQAQPTLSGDTANAAKIKEALQAAYKVTLPDYKMFVVNVDAANDLYAKYRDLYIQTNCVAATKK